jgi:putative component of toxin-antitoxin plasmid stabilization module
MRRKLRWRDYRTAARRRPVKEFIDALGDEDVAAIVAGMKEVTTLGLVAARHLRGEIYEVRVDGTHVAYRILFAQETKFILLAVSAFVKKTRATPENEIRNAEERLADWRRRPRTRPGV